MHIRQIREGIDVICNVDWGRRLFDSLIPLPDGTSYNAYIVYGSEGVALIDSGDPCFREQFLKDIEPVKHVDFIVSQHAEQDHSGLLPEMVERYPKAPVLCSDKARDMLITHLGIPAERIRVVADGEEVSLGDKTMKFFYTPWVHWPETMCTYVPELKTLFSCDFFGSHLATSDLFVTDAAQVYEAAKRYFSEIMMPFSKTIVRNLAKVAALDFDLIAPGHGPAFDNPAMIVDAYHEWTGPKMKNEVVLPYISMHGSTKLMVDYLIDALAMRGVKVLPFDLAVTDIGKLAMSLVDTATIIIGTPTVHVGVHPLVHYAAYLANLLKPKVKYAAVIGSYGWGSKAVDQIVATIPNLKVDVLGAVTCKGVPTAEVYSELDSLADAVAAAHKADENVV